jgi:hypothetical protein
MTRKKYVSIDPGTAEASKKYVPISPNDCCGKRDAIAVHPKDQSPINPSIEKTKYVPIERGSQTISNSFAAHVAHSYERMSPSDSSHFSNYEPLRKPGVHYFTWNDTKVGLYVPSTYVPTTEPGPHHKFLFLISGNGQAYWRFKYIIDFVNNSTIQAWSENNGLIVVCPLFDRQFYPFDRKDVESSLFTTYNSGVANCRCLDQHEACYDPDDFFYDEKLYYCLKENFDVTQFPGWYPQPDEYLVDFIQLINKAGRRSDERLIEIFGVVKDIFNFINPTPTTFSIYGFSAGAQFITRFMVFYPELLDTIMIGSPGSCTFPCFTTEECREMNVIFNEYVGKVSKFTYPLTLFPEFYTDDLALPGDLTDALQDRDYMNKNLAKLMRKNIILISHREETACNKGIPPDEPRERSWQGLCPSEINTNYYHAWFTRHNMLRREGYLPQGHDFRVVNKVLCKEPAGHDWRPHAKWLKEHWDCYGHIKQPVFERSYKPTYIKP